MSLERIAAAADVSVYSARAVLRSLGRRGRCDTAAVELFNSSHAATRHRSATSTLSPPNVARLAAADSDLMVRDAARGVAGWTSRALGVVAAPRSHVAVSAAGVDTARRDAAGYPGCPPAILERLAADPDPEVRAAVAGSDEISDNLAWRLADDPSTVVVGAVAANPACAVTLLGMIADGTVGPSDDRRQAARAEAAANANCPPQVLERLSSDRDINVRSAVAGNVSCPSEIVQRLVCDDWVEVAQEAAANPACGESTVQQIATNSQEADLVAATARNPNCPRWLLQRLAQHDAWEVRRSVAGRADCGPSTFQRLSHDHDEDVRGAVAANPACAAHVLGRLAVDTIDDVRAAVAANLNCPPRVLRRLKSDPIAAVKQIAAANSAALGRVPVHAAPRNADSRST